MAWKNVEPAPEFYCGSKYMRVARWLRNASGTLLDLGARDRILSRSLPATISYASSDLDGSDHEYRFDISRPFPLPDRAFDYVVALDVLEHIDNAHDAASELCRIARREVFIALPNMASWQHRAAFLRTGRLATDKYDMRDCATVDRHRWLPTWPGMHGFVRGVSRANGWRIAEVVAEAETPGPVSAVAMRVIRATGCPPTSALVRRVIWRLTRD